MNKKTTFLLGLFFCLMGSISISKNSANCLQADSNTTTYNAITNFAKAFGSNNDTTATTQEWTFEALNLVEFFREEQGVNLLNEEGSFYKINDFRNEIEDTTNFNNGTLFTDRALSLRTYPLFINSTKKDNFGRYFNQYPQGWKMTNVSPVETVDAWPRGKCSASNQKFKFYMNGRTVLDTGCSLAVYFRAPKTGTVHFTDKISVLNESSDGVASFVVHVPAKETIYWAWNSEAHNGFLGGKPIYPNAGVYPTADYSTGWKKVFYGNSSKYQSQTFDIGKDDLLMFVYSSYLTADNDTLTINPEVVYEEDSSEITESKLSSKKDETTTYLNSFRNDVDYRADDQETINVLVDEYIDLISTAETVNRVNEILDAFATSISAIKKDCELCAIELEEYKTSSINELDALLADYLQEDTSIVSPIILQAKVEVNKCLTIEEIDYQILVAKSKLKETGCITVTETKLIEAKNNAKDEINSYKDKGYKGKKYNEVLDIISEGLSQIDECKTEDEVNTKLAEIKTKLDSVSKGNSSTVIGIILICIAAGLLIFDGVYFFLKKKKKVNE